MPTLANLVLTDRAGTPVAHTFVPRGRPNGVGTLVESSGVLNGERKFSIGTRTSATKRKITLRLVLPVVATETINGVSNPKIVRTAYANIEFTFDAASTTQERKDCVGMLQNALDSSKTMVDKILVDNEDLY